MDESSPDVVASSPPTLPPPEDDVGGGELSSPPEDPEELPVPPPLEELCLAGGVAEKFEPEFPDDPQATVATAMNNPKSFP